MKYKVLLPPPKRGSRLTETIGVRSKQIAFNRAIASRIRIPSAGEAYIGLAANEDGFLCLTVLRGDSAGTAFRVTRPKTASGTQFIAPGRGILSRIPAGRFAITGQEDGWWITACPYHE